MTDPTRDGSGRVARDRSGGADGGAHYEEAITVSDGRIAGFSPVLTVQAVVGVGTAVVALLMAAAFFGFVGFMSGTSPVDIVTTVVSDLPLPILLSLAAFAVVFFGLSLLPVLGAVDQRSRTSKNEVHTRVTDGGVDIDRRGDHPGRSPGVTVPFEAITTVEYSDPGSDPAIGPEDADAEKFLAGRTTDWVRIGRDDGRVVYVGSDRPRALAEVVADLAPAVDGPEPLS